MSSTGFRGALIALTMMMGLGASSAWAQTIGGRPLPVHGDETAVVEIVEVSDFQCPHCAKVQTTLAEVARAYPSKVRFTFVQQPLSFHDRALPAALATVVAQSEGKFWDFAKLLFAEQAQISAENTRSIATRLGIERARIDAVMRNPAAIAFVRANRKVASSVGARGTPTFFINGTAIRGAKPLERFKAIIDVEVALAGTKALSASEAAAYRQKRTLTFTPTSTRARPSPGSRWPPVIWPCRRRPGRCLRVTMSPCSRPRSATTTPCAATWPRPW